ncbi:glycosyl hydrolase family 43 protein [Moniliophthora roreri]|nr:glycosyl hydrolase family 43 protein [Moniliophthora roreri]
MVNWTSLLVAIGLCLSTYAAVIVPGATWTDMSGNVIQAHGGGFLKVGSTFYWYGEDKAHNSGLFRAVSCYTSTDLVSWTRQNDALTPQSNTMISTSNIVERPKVIFNKKNSEYVMWFHSDSSNYGAAMVGVATAKSPCGTSYLLYASDNNQNFKISRLDDNYYNVTQQVNVISGSTLESPGIIKRNGSLSGSWSAQADIAPQPTRTYFSQNTFDMLLGNNGIYMGDRWRPSLLGSSRYMWFPLSWDSGNPQIVPADVWSVNVAAGTFSVASGTTYEAESGTISGSARTLTDSAWSGGRGVGYLGNGGTLTINNVQGTGNSAGQWVALYYANGDSSWRNTTVRQGFFPFKMHLAMIRSVPCSVNGGTSVLVDQPNTGSGHSVLSVPVKLNLRSGANSITFSSCQSNYAADLDKIIVYTAT